MIPTTTKQSNTTRTDAVVANFVQSLLWECQSLEFELKEVKARLEAREKQLDIMAEQMMASERELFELKRWRTRNGGKR